VDRHRTGVGAAGLCNRGFSVIERNRGDQFPSSANPGYPRIEERIAFVLAEDADGSLPVRTPRRAID
jgi:hypothetical protein